MADDDTDYRQYAGRVAFPRTPADLTSTSQCPACFATLRGTTCSVCGLDLAHPAAAQLADMSQGIAKLLDHRLDLIGRIRFDTAQKTHLDKAPSEVSVAANVVSAAASVASVPAVAEPATAPPPPPPAATARVPVPPPAREHGRSSVQVVLLIVGISLLSIAAIFFLVYAFITFGLLARSLIIGGITVAAFVVASLLRRRSLNATGEGIAVFAVVLVYLDAFALRANDFFGLAQVDALTYCGLTLLVSAIVFVAWNRISGMRTASIVGFAAFAPGLGMVAGSWAGSNDRAYVLFGTMALGGLVHRLAARPDRPATAERVIVLSTTVLALLVGIVGAFGFGFAADFGATLALAALAVVALLHVAALDLRAPQNDSPAVVFGGLFAAYAGFVGAGSVAAAALRTEEIAFVATVPIAAATAIALLFELSGHRLRDRLRSHSRIAAIGAAVVAGIIALVPFGALLWLTIASAVGGTVRSWTLTPDASLVTIQNGYAWAALGLASAVALAALAWLAGGVLRRRSPALIWAVAMLLVLATPLLSSLWLVLVARLLLAAIAVGALIVLRRRSAGGPSIRGAVLTTLTASVALAYLAGWASSATWLAVTLIVTVLLLAARAGFAHTASRAAPLGVASAVLLIGASALARQLALPLHPAFLADAVNALRAAGILAIVLLGLAAIVRAKQISLIDRRVVFWVATATTAVTTFGAHAALRGVTTRTAPGLLLPEYGTALVLSVLLLAALLAWTVLPSNAALRPERVVASLGLASGVYWLVDSFTRVLGLGEFAVSVAPVTAALLAAAGALTVTLLRPGVTARWAREVGVAIIAVPAVLIAVARPSDSTWLVLVIAAVTALVLAISNDGLFASTSPRRHLGWLALALATAGLWWRLGTNRISALEPYVLPVAGALLLIALLLWYSARRRGTTTRAAAPLALAGLLVAIVPLALAAASGQVVRALIVGAASAALLLVGSFVLGSARLRPYLDAAALAGAIGLILVTTGRAVTVNAERGDPDWRLDAWLVGGVLVLVIAAFGQARERADDQVALRRVGSQVLAVLALFALLALELPGLHSALGSLRAFALVLLYCAIHLIAFIVNRAPLSIAIAWTSIGFAGVAAIGGVVSGALDWVEAGTVPIALALLATGAIHLAATPAARSWAWLAPGVSVLLIPSLLATIWEAPLWRLVALGVVGVAIIALSAVYRLQAPFIIATVVVLIHAIATFSPQIRALYQSVEWWLWLAIGGIIIVVIGARFEKSKRGFKRVAMTIKALR